MIDARRSGGDDWASEALMPQPVVASDPAGARAGRRTARPRAQDVSRVTGALNVDEARTQ